MRSQKISFAGLSQPFEQTYAYDDLNRLQSATETINNGATTTWKQTFQYDRFGNRRFDAANTTNLSQSAPTKITNPLINTSDNRLKKDQDGDSLNDYDYDKTGNLTQDSEGKQFLYDAENHQKEVLVNGVSKGKYLYDGEGKRVKKISDLETTIFVYNGGGQLVAEYSTQQSATPQVSFLTADHLGSPRIITDNIGKVIARKDFNAFGDETNSAQRTEPLGYKPEETRQDYTGYQKDEESGLEFAQARYYNNRHGRFTSVDPLTASANVKDPQTFNRYSYAMNSPYKFTDPLGLRAMDVGSGSSHGSDVGYGHVNKVSEISGEYSYLFSKYQVDVTATVNSPAPTANHEAGHNTNLGGAPKIRFDSVEIFDNVGDTDAASKPKLPLDAKYGSDSAKVIPLETSFVPDGSIFILKIKVSLEGEGRIVKSSNPNGDGFDTRLEIGAMLDNESETTGVSRQMVLANIPGTEVKQKLEISEDGASATITAGVRVRDEWSRDSTFRVHVFGEYKETFGPRGRINTTETVTASLSFRFAAPKPSNSRDIYLKKP
jgi:RHS repeat-associated protein